MILMLFVEAMSDLDEDAVKDMLNQVMEEGGKEAQRVLDACKKGMDQVGARFEAGEYFVGVLIYAGELMTDAVNILKTSLVSDSGGDIHDKMILCTVKNDLHDIGKNIVRSMLEAAGFEVVDLGIDVPAEKIIDAIQKETVKIIALSGVLTLALDSMKEAVDAIRSAGLNDVRVIIGGAPVSEAACAFVGADAWAHSPQKTVSICREWAGINEQEEAS